MATEHQIEANRTNAQKSTGPKTPEGRDAVRLNGLKHGLTAATLVLKGESESDFESLLDSFDAEHRPSTPTEEALVRQMAMAQWRLRRLYHIEAGLFAVGLRDLKHRFKTPQLADNLAIVVNDDCLNSNALVNLSRYEARLERAFYRALQELQRLRAQRPLNLKKQTQSKPIRRETLSLALVPPLTAPPENEIDQSPPPPQPPDLQ